MLTEADGLSGRWSNMKVTQENVNVFKTSRIFCVMRCLKKLLCCKTNNHAMKMRSYFRESSETDTHLRHGFTRHVGKFRGNQHLLHQGS